jgi:hypothetical protein
MATHTTSSSDQAQQRKRSARRNTKGEATTQALHEAAARRLEGLPVTHAHAAGVDSGSRSHWVCVGANETAQVREFPAHTDGFQALVAFRQEHQVPTVARQSTGSYWVPLYELLETHGCEVLRVDPRYPKPVVHGGGAAMPVVLVRDPTGEWQNGALVCTDGTLPAVEVITGYCRTIATTRALLGLYSNESVSLHETNEFLKNKSRRSLSRPSPNGLMTHCAEAARLLSQFCGVLNTIRRSPASPYSLTLGQKTIRLHWLLQLGSGSRQAVRESLPFRLPFACK